VGAIAGSCDELELNTPETKPADGIAGKGRFVNRPYVNIEVRE
jgi:hypothetical protein